VTTSTRTYTTLWDSFAYVLEKLRLPYNLRPATQRQSVDDKAPEQIKVL
jgi:hypothetical protein